MRRTNRNPKFWTILSIANIAAITYPVHLCVNADGYDQQVSAIVILLSVGFLLAIVDAISAICAYL